MTTTIGLDLNEVSALSSIPLQAAWCWWLASRSTLFTSPLFIVILLYLLILSVKQLVSFFLSSLFTRHSSFQFLVLVLSPAKMFFFFREQK